MSSSQANANPGNLQGLNSCSSSAITRRVSKPWKVPGTETILPVGVSVFLPWYSLHMDPEFWENPSEFNPERFNSENKANIRNGSYGPFGLGPRGCLGSSYAKFMMKMMIAYLVRFFEIENCDSLQKDFKIDPETLFVPLGGFKIKFHKRNV